VSRADGQPRVSAERVFAWGQEMRAVHQRLRDALDIAREAVENGRRPQSPASKDLQLYCGGFCVALSGHHRSEDATLFPLILRAHPELADTVGTLVQDHAMIAHLIQGLDAAIRGEAGKELLLEHLDGIEAVMETHFRFEERRLVGPLDTIAAAGTDKAALYGAIAADISDPIDDGGSRD
jgi:hypothetical protein